MGHARAFAMLVMGRPLSAQAAKEAGLVNEVVDGVEVDTTALKAARDIAGLPPGAVATARALIRGNLDDVAQRIDTEAMRFKELLGSDEARAAFAAFFARKK
jgi:enoyl-CoA hydratase/carnithine racemase